METKAITISISDFNLDFTYPNHSETSANDSSDLIETIKKLDKIPFNKGDFYYSDSSWDFSSYTMLNIRKDNLKFNFMSCPDSFVCDLKNFVLLRILENKAKIQSINKEFLLLNNFFKYAENNNCFTIEEIPFNKIYNYLQEKRGQSITLEQAALSAIKSFFKTYKSNFINPLDVSINEIFKYKVSGFVATKNNNKIPDIPKNFFNPFMSACLKIANDNTKDTHQRAIACFYIIISQTGLRSSECLSIDVDGLESAYLSNNNIAYYLNYKTWKNVQGNDKYSTQTTYINELSKKAFDILVDIYKEDRDKLGVKYLYLGSKKRINSGNYPIDTHEFYRSQINFIANLNEYFPVINVDDNTYEGIDNKRITEKYLKNKYPDIKTIAVPKNHQFRVHACTELYNKGVPLKYIQKFMSHLSESMTSYYIRTSPNQPQEDMQFATDTLKKIVQGEVKLLGPSNGLIDKIKEFIEENNYNVKTDIDEICASLAKKIPIRQKTGGVCIKSSMLRDCAVDAKTNEFYCAYNVCPNIFHFFYMVNVSYRQAKELVETIKINFTYGFETQVQKEVNMLQNIINKKLEPEFIELKNMLDKKGEDAIIAEYPDLEEIVLKYEEIKKEIDEWKNLKPSEINLERLARIMIV